GWVPLELRGPAPGPARHGIRSEQPRRHVLRPGRGRHADERDLDGLLQRLREPQPVGSEPDELPAGAEQDPDAVDPDQLRPQHDATAERVGELAEPDERPARWYAG